MDSSRDEIGDVLARELYLGARLDPLEAPGAPRVAAALLGESCLHSVPSKVLPANGVLRQVGAAWVIDVRENLNASQLNHAVAHELAEWFLRCRGYAEADFDELSGRVAAALCVPRPAFDAARLILGEDLQTLSRWFRVSESLMALRCAECLGPATALITPNKIRTRGNAWEWPLTRDHWDEVVARPEQSGLRAQIPTDVRGRVILRAI